MYSDKDAADRRKRDTEYQAEICVAQKDALPKESLPGSNRYTQPASVLDFANRFKKFIFDDNYQPANAGVETAPFLGFMIAGYSASPGPGFSEQYELVMQGDRCEGPTALWPDEPSAISWRGQGEAVSRLLLGFSPKMEGILQAKMGLSEDVTRDLLNTWMQDLGTSLSTAAMPIGDAIDLAEFLVSLTIKYFRFLPGASTVGGPIEVAAITKHEGYKWVKRKHYYGQEFNL